jgi:hypothetical protein
MPIQAQSYIATPKRKVFISYHHRNDQAYKERLLEINRTYDIFIDASVDTGDIDDSLSSQAIRQKIRGEYLANSTVTILLVGTETKFRKHVDWELYSSMIDGSVNKRSGILVINLPSTNSTTFTVAHPNEKEIVHPECQSWTSVSTRTEYEQRYPYMPDRIVDNLLEPEALISVAPWEKLTKEQLAFLIEATFQDKDKCKYDMSREMRRADHNPNI